MTEREFILAKIKLHQQWLMLLSKGNMDKESFGLPKGVSIQEEIDRVLDELIELRKQLRRLDEQ
ncbi:MAG: hypothetical protein IT258_05910 [Saprospiraceae bacterium]|jgi:hypothetical protein|nr:hypothetical protein [Saprospiraceae bacterium]